MILTDSDAILTDNDAILIITAWEVEQWVEQQASCDILFLLLEEGNREIYIYMSHAFLQEAF